MRVDFQTESIYNSCSIKKRFIVFVRGGVATASYFFIIKRCLMMDQKRLEYLRQVERHADETGWVAPLTQEERTILLI